MFCVILLLIDTTAEQRALGAGGWAEPRLRNEKNAGCEKNQDKAARTLSRHAELGAF